MSRKETPKGANLQNAEAPIHDSHDTKILSTSSRARLMQFRDSESQPETGCIYGSKSRGKISSS